MEIAASWRRRLPMKSHSPLKQRLNHSVSVGAGVITWCTLLLQTDFEVAPPKPLAIKKFASTDRTFRDEEIFFFMEDRYFSATEYLNSGANPPILVRQEWDHRLREHVKT